MLPAWLPASWLEPVLLLSPMSKVLCFRFKLFCVWFWLPRWNGTTSVSRYYVLDSVMAFFLPVKFSTMWRLTNPLVQDSTLRSWPVGFRVKHDPEKWFSVIFVQLVRENWSIAAVIHSGGEQRWPAIGTQRWQIEVGVTTLQGFWRHASWAGAYVSIRLKAFERFHVLLHQLVVVQFLWK